MVPGGLETESDYPYRAENMKCQFESSKTVVNINGSITISENEDRENFLSLLSLTSRH